jgi:hypothetical protein
MAGAEARAKLDVAIRTAMKRKLTGAEEANFKTVERQVQKLAAKLGQDRISRLPYGTRKQAVPKPRLP